LSLKDERSNDVTPGAGDAPPAHLFALELGRLLRGHAGPRAARVLLVGVGSGRNVVPLLAAGLRVDAVECDPARARAAEARFAAQPRVCVVQASYAGPLPFPGVMHAAALSTHALLHGTPAGVAASLRAVADRLSAGAPFYATLGSQNDPRFGAGQRIGEETFAPLAGPERGAAHTYVSAAGARRLFATDFVVESLAEVSAGEHVGRWAHDEADAATIVHWFVRARKAGTN